MNTRVKKNEGMRGMLVNNSSEMLTHVILLYQHETL